MIDCKACEDSGWTLDGADSIDDTISACTACLKGWMWRACQMVLAGGLVAFAMWVYHTC